MSRHLLVALPHCEGYEVVVGWDSAAGTFFAFVLNRQAGEGKDPWMVNVGAAPAEVLRPGAVLDAVRPYAVVPAGLVDELAAEAAAAPASGDRLRVLAGDEGPPVMPSASSGATAPDGSADR
jgi:hypothetical protein